MRLSRSRCPIQEKYLFFTDEIQDCLLDITFPLAENDDVWQDVWCPTMHQVQDDTVLVHRGDFAIKDSKDLPLTGCFAQEPLAENRLGTMQRLTTNLHEKVFGFFRLFLR